MILKKMAICDFSQFFSLDTSKSFFFSKVFDEYLKHRDSFGKENKKNKTCSIFDKTLSKVFLNNFQALNLHVS